MPVYFWREPDTMDAEMSLLQKIPSLRYEIPFLEAGWRISVCRVLASCGVF